MKQFIDANNRVVKYLRISVTDRCDFRCVYCMAEKMTFLPKSKLITLEETARIAKIFDDYGVTKIRLTGGEPLIRRNITWLISEINNYPSINKIAITTNGSNLNKLSNELKSAGVTKLNISIDTLSAVQFKKITRIGNLNSVLTGIDTAIKAGITNIRLNAVIIRGQNDNQIIPLVEYAISKNIDIAFIEEMPLGNTNYDRNTTYISSEEIQNIILEKYNLIGSGEYSDGPAKYWGIENTNTKIGFISPNSCNFCASCNRVRLTVEGRLLLCLGHENSIDLKKLMRDGKSDKEIANEIQTALQNKPEKHLFNISEKPVIFRYMNETGG